jgi:hypothetical protein
LKVEDYSLKRSWAQDQLEEALDEIAILGHAERMSFDTMWEIKLDLERSIDRVIYPVGFDPLMHDGFYNILRGLEDKAAERIEKAKLAGDNQELFKQEGSAATIKDVLKQYRSYMKFN